MKLLRKWHYLKYHFSIRTDTITNAQLKSPKTIPILIINFNQLYYFNKLIEFLTGEGFENIVVIDNQSTYPPLLEYYKKIEGLSSITIERMSQNHGHRVFFENILLQKKYGQGYYVITDSDINFYHNYPKNFINEMIKLLNKFHQDVTKVGLALNLDYIPDHYDLKEKVVKWEKRFWENEVTTNVYKAPIDTTFALYLPGFPHKNNKNDFYRALRIGGDYVVKHCGWYHNSKKPSKEHLYYIQSTNKSYSWKTDESGKIIGDLKNIY